MSAFLPSCMTVRNPNARPLIKDQVHIHDTKVARIIYLNIQVPSPARVSFQSLHPITTAAGIRTVHDIPDSLRDASHNLRGPIHPCLSPTRKRKLCDAS
jgi:hypothetical protein